MGVTTVTREQFARFVDDAGYTTTAERRGRSVVNTASGLKYANGVTWTTPIGDASGDMPVVHVSDVDAVAFCKWASQRSGRKVRLPTEAEWEYACRAGTQTPHAGDLNNMGWFADNSGDAALDSAALIARRDGSFSKAIIANHCRPHPVAKKKPNAWGLYDMHANVWEWCSDAYADYPPGRATDPTGPLVEKPRWRCARGGSWANYASITRSANRGNWGPGASYDMIGFRIVVEE